LFTTPWCGAKKKKKVNCYVALPPFIGFGKVAFLFLTHSVPALKLPPWTKESRSQAQSTSQVTILESAKALRDAGPNSNWTKSWTQTGSIILDYLANSLHTKEDGGPLPRENSTVNEFAG